MEQDKLTDKEKEELWFSSLAADDTYTYDVDQAFERFRRRTGKLSRPRFRFRTVWAVTAAAVLLVLLVSTVSYKLGEQELQKKFSDMVVEAPPGSKSKLFLPDGTLVWLNAGSRIVYSQAFGVNDRRLELSGEAYFEVIKNDALPFAVKTRELQVTVLGTKFNFRNYADDREAVVNLLEGRVQLDNRMKEMDACYLAPSEKVVLNKATGEMTISKTKAAYSREWTNDCLFFDEMFLPDIVKNLERTFDVKITIEEESLKTDRFYALFHTREQSVEDVLNILGRTGKLSYEIKGDSIRLYRNQK